MANEILKLDMLENLLQRQWTEYLDYVRLMRTVMEYVRDTQFQEIKQQKIPNRQAKVTVTNVSATSYHNEPVFELWLEFSIPKEDGVVIGTIIGNISIKGEFYFTEKYGTFFKPENS